VWSCDTDIMMYQVHLWQMHLPYWLVYPLVIILVGGFIAWGEMSGGRRMKVEEDVTGLIIFSCLLVGFLFTFYSMYKRLDHAADPTRRMMAYDMVDDKEPRWKKRHALGISHPWDSYQWVMGTLIILISMIFWGVNFPVLHGEDRIWAYCWIGIFSVLTVSVVWINSFDPSYVVEDLETLEKDGASIEGEGLVLYCKLKGCQCYYRGKYRKHCMACGKCVTGFDHHCPFLNQCIGDKNYRLFMVVLLSYNTMCFYVLSVGGYIIVQLYTPGSYIHDQGGRVWGKVMFAVLTGTMQLFALMQLPFLTPLLIFHLQLCWTTLRTGEFQASYMFTADRKTGKMRGIGSYLDERARHTLEWCAHINFMDQQSAMTIWKEWMENERHLKKNTNLVSSMSSINKKLIQMTSAIQLEPEAISTRFDSEEVDDIENKTPLLGNDDDDEMQIPANMRNKLKKEKNKTPGCFGCA